jgi:tetratricopeptide (TPR) repeat protein
MSLAPALLYKADVLLPTLGGAMQRVGLVMFASIALWIGSTTSGGAQPTTQDFVSGALQACHDGRIASDRATRVALYEKGQSLGEQAVAADEKSADAHFALFCNLGELMRIDGEMSVSSVFGFRRMMKELNRALELKPDHLDALSARGTLLVRLPSLLGGDPETGEQLLRHVIQQEPEAVNARISLAKSYCKRGRHQDAMALATEALTLAKVQQLDDFIPEASKVVAQLHAAGNKGN